MELKCAHVITAKKNKGAGVVHWGSKVNVPGKEVKVKVGWLCQVLRTTMPRLIRWASFRLTSYVIFSPSVLEFTCGIRSLFYFIDN